MSQENVEIVKRANALFNRGDWDEMTPLCTADVVLRDLRNAADTHEVLEGLESVRALLVQWGEVFDDVGAEIYEYVDARPYVVCDARWHAKGRQSETPVDIRQADVYELRDGKIAVITLGYPTKAEALQAVGLSDTQDRR
jgi:ketosteroid isomerase-like protein